MRYQGPDDNEGVNDPWDDNEREYAKQVEEDARDRSDNEHGK